MICNSVIANMMRKNIIWTVLLIVPISICSGGIETMIDSKSDKTKEDLEKIQQTLKQLNVKSQKSEENDKDVESALKAVLELNLGPKPNETIDETANNAGILGYVMGGDIAVNPDQATKLMKGAGLNDEHDQTERRRVRRASLFGLARYLGNVASRIFYDDTELDIGAGANDDPVTTIDETDRDPPLLVPNDDVQDATVTRAKRGYQTDPKYAWDPSKPIPYFFDPSMAASYIPLIRDGIAFWQNNTCLTFVEDPNGDSALRFYMGSTCSASLGRQGTKTQDVSIGSGCNNLGTVTHEIAHAIGFFHLMSSPNRDNFVTINRANIPKELMYNFEPNAPSADENYGVNFDYGSVMLYNQYAFATDNNIPTIVALNKWMQNTMGQRVAPAFSDIKMMNKAFKCDAKCTGKTCSNGGFPNSKDCTSCICPRGFGGPSCDTTAPNTAPVCNGATLTATSDWQSVDGKVGTDDYTPYKTFTECFWMIKAPAGKKVSFRLKAAPSSCVQTCTWQGLEIIMGNFDAYGVAMCCPSFIDQEFTSTDNLAIIRGFSRSNLAIFTFEYKAV